MTPHFCLNQVAWNKAVFFIDRYRLFAHTYDTSGSAIKLCLIKNRVFFYLSFIRGGGFFDFLRLDDIIFLYEHVDLFGV